MIIYQDIDEPLDPPNCRRLIRRILSEGSVRFSKHALEEIAKDDLAEIDIVNVLRGGFPGPGEFENGSWRYCVKAQRIAVVVAFRSEASLVVVTAWRF
jgi:hypothetical protein